MTRKAALYLILIFLIFGLIGECSYRFSLEVPYADLMCLYGFGLAELITIILLLAYGTLLQKKRFKIPIAVCTVLMIFSAFIKIMHFAIADFVLSFSAFVIITVYSIHFITKKHKQVSDYLKWFWVTTRFALSALLILHIVSSEWLYIANGLLCLTLGVYLWEQWKYNRLQEEEE